MYQTDLYKASHDDLIDEYASPYALSSKHKSYTLGPVSKQSMSTEEDGQKEFDGEENAGRSVAYPPPVPQIPQKDTRTFWQKLLPDSMACRLYVVTVLIETAIDLAIEADLLVRFHEAEKGQSNQTASQKMPVYLSVFAFAHVFQLGMALDAVYARNTLQFISLTAFNALLLFYAIVQTSEVRHSLTDVSEAAGISHLSADVLTTVLPIVIAVSQIAYLALGWKIYNEFGWKVYKFLGADRRIKKMFTHYQIFQCLVKFDVFFWVGFCVQFIWLVLQNGNWEFYITCAALPLSLVLLIEGHLAARYENKWMMATFMTGCFGAMVYFVYKLVKVLVKRNTPDFVPIWQTLVTFSIISIVLLIATFVYSFIVMINFGRGLKEQIKKKQAQAGMGTKHAVYPSMFARPNRMSID